ncbi:MAG: citramalate synthase [Alphaproteobacteria bacterium]|nr:citramalate synthase [Alphaproteobacteria bacterium]
MSAQNYVTLFDTTLRDGAQTRGVDLSVKDKNFIATLLDEIGVDYIEGGWPGANPTDDAFFAAPPPLRARFTAFGMTHRGRKAEDDPLLQTVLNAADHVCLFGKNWDRHVSEALRISLEENLGVIAASVALGVKRGKEVLYDAEHFFDGYKADPAYAVRCLRAAFEAGANWLVLCDTNGGCLPHEVFRIVGEVKTLLPNAPLGIHAHNDCGCAVANSLEAVRAGCRMVQGTLNGLGERCGNADMMTLIPLLEKMGYQTGVSPQQRSKLTQASRALDELLDRSPNDAQPFVGRRAFAHKAGMHVSAIAKNPELYEHAPPESVGNEREIVMSDQAGRANAAMRLRELGVDVDDKDPRLATVVERVKEREARGYSYGNAPESFALLAKNVFDPAAQPPFGIDGFYTANAVALGGEEAKSEAEARVAVRVGDAVTSQSATGNGPVNALDLALRKALLPFFPVLENVRLSDYHVRILDTKSATAATTRVCLEMEDMRSGKTWRTVGVSPNIVTASVEALREGYAYCCASLNQGKN